jgi:sulfite reductase (ferredoxin)
MSHIAKQFVSGAKHGPASAVEGVKAASRRLRGAIEESLTDNTDAFGEDDKHLLKFHGTYQQDNRDARKSRRNEGAAKQHIFMVRCKIPGGRLSPDQYLALDDLAGTHGNETLRLTSRQGIQFHGVLKKRLKGTIEKINATLLTTLGACGDVVRNVMACPMSHDGLGLHQDLYDAARKLAAHFAPRTNAYHEIWLDGEKVPTTRESEPIYGQCYLPRKFKMAVALPEDNCVDVYSQDLAFLAVVEGARIQGYNVLAGGGMGMTHGNAETFPCLARPIAYVPAAELIPIAEAVVRLFRDHGDRSDRKHARLKYIVHEWGTEHFREVLGTYVGRQPEPPVNVKVGGFDSHLGWRSQGDGRFYYGLRVENGRISDDSGVRLRSCLREVIARLRPDIRLSPQQDILLCNLHRGAYQEIDALLEDFGVRPPEAISQVRQHSMACPAMPTCGLALAESERVMPELLDRLEKELDRLGLGEEKLSVRMTGCPNGCARPYQSDIGIVGRSGDKYTVFVGGHILGTRLNFMLRDLVPFHDIVPLLVPLLDRFRRGRRSDESFGDFCHRISQASLQAAEPPVHRYSPPIEKARKCAPNLAGATPLPLVN